MPVAAAARSWLAVMIAILAAAASGCQPGPSFRIAEVKGTVTIDGKPAPGLTVQFEPQSPDPRGRIILPAAYGFTDADGKYTLRRPGRNKTGAAVGLNHVRITAAEGESGPLGQAHPRYGQDNAIWYEVQEGTNTYDIELREDPTARRAK